MPGNDDLGAMSSWWVRIALGLDSAVPGSDVPTPGSPLFPAGASVRGADAGGAAGPPRPPLRTTLSARRGRATAATAGATRGT